jgi:uncharacterized protein with HEPN domain
MPRDKQYLQDIIEAAKLAAGYVADVTREDFYQDIEKQDAVIRRLEIIGEASRRLSEEIKAAYPDVPWRKMIGMRNIIIHEYDDVDMNVVWETAKDWLPELIEALEKI